MTSTMTSSRSPAKIIPKAFPGITPDEVSELIGLSKVNTYPPDTTLCTEDALEYTFYLILEGDVEVTKVINQAEARLLKTLGPGDFFGEMALIHNAPRAATVRSVSPLVVLEINKDDFARVLKKSSSMSLSLVRVISSRLRENDELAIDDLRVRARELAEAYQKLAEQELARREFLTNIAHQLRTPLMAANGYLQLVQQGAIPAEQVPTSLKTIARNVNQIMRLVNDILFIQELELIMGKFQPVDPQALVQQIADSYHDKAVAAGVTLSIESEPQLPAISGDPKHLERALESLIDNAIKFSPEGGPVTIRLSLTGEFVLISVTDQGIGIEPDRLMRIFDRFYHLDKRDGKLFEGLGLGLAITKQVIEQHKGRLEVDSSLGMGSTFSVWLRVWDE